MPPTEPNSSLSWSGHTDRGRVRKNNEDAFLGLSIDEREVHYLGKMGSTSETKNYVFAVCDGIGGAMAGEFASRIAVEKITKMFPSFLASMVTTPPQQEEEKKACYALLTKLFQEIHRSLLFLGSSYEECHGMGTTLTLGWFRSGSLYFAHVGDSRLYHLPAAGGIHQLSEDDTHVGWLFRQGALNEREAKSHPRRNFLQKALGAEHQFASPQIGSLPCSPGDNFLFCTDGVTDALFNHHLLDLLTLHHPTKSRSQYLVEESVAQSGRDNTTAMVIEIT